MFSKVGKGLRWLGEKASSGASFLGNKIGGAMMSLSPAISMFAPQVGAGVASAGAVLKGVGALGDMGQAMLKGGDINTHQVRRTVDNIRSDAAGVKAAYSAVRGPGNPLERRR